MLVSRSLPDWILDVELSDAVEYIIPLLNGLGTDGELIDTRFRLYLERSGGY